MWHIMQYWCWDFWIFLFKQLHNFNSLPSLWQAISKLFHFPRIPFAVIYLPGLLCSDQFLLDLYQWIWTHPLCVYMFVCVAQSLRGQLQLHCCAPLSLAFLSELKPSHGIFNFCFQPDCSSAARSSPIMTPSISARQSDGAFARDAHPHSQ